VVRKPKIMASVLSVALVGVSAVIWASPEARQAVGETLPASVSAELDAKDADLAAAEREVAQLRQQNDRLAGQVQSQTARADDHRARAGAAEDTAARRAADASHAKQEAGASAATASRARTAAEAAKERAERAEAARARARSSTAARSGGTTPPMVSTAAAAARPPAAPAAAAPAVPVPSAPPPPVPSTPDPLPQTLTVEEIEHPTLVHYGAYTDQAPFAWGEFSFMARRAGKEPNLVGYFLGWDQEFRSDAVVESWERGIIPLLTWESLPNGDVGAKSSDFQLQRIIAGEHDAYIDRFATAVKDLGLPLVIRLDHEMNGNWYPWGEGTNGNSKGEYVQMWRHVVDRFRNVGADQHVVWLWAPNRVDSTPGEQTIAQFYPGDDYVDWVGIDGYHRYADDTPTFTDTFGRTLAQLRELTSKPIVLAEIGATEVGGTKVPWIQSLFEGLALNPDIIGFFWFNQAKSTTKGGEVVTNDWRIHSTNRAAEVFAAGVADPRYAGRLIE
jgi:mannan endo-1,4-beta-mannosidase